MRAVDAPALSLSVSSGDERSSVSSSRGLGSINVAGSSRRSVPDLVLSPGVRLILTSGMMGVFSADAARSTVVSTALSHGLPMIDIRDDLQRSLLDHVLSGHCVQTGSDQLYLGCMAVARGFEEVSSLGLSVRHGILGALRDEQGLGSDVQHLRHLCSLLHIPVADIVSDEHGDRDMRDDLCDFVCAYGVRQSGERNTHGPDFIQSLDQRTLPQLRSLADAHGISYPGTCSRDNLRVLLTAHVVHGRCSAKGRGEEGYGCLAVRSSVEYENSAATTSLTDFQIQLLTTLGPRLHRKALRRTLDAHGVTYNTGMSRGQLRRTLKAYVNTLRKGKSVESLHALMRPEIHDPLEGDRDQVRDQWPQTVPSHVKDMLVQAFRDETCSETLREFCCGSCAGSFSQDQKTVCRTSELPLELLRLSAHASCNLPSSEFPFILGEHGDDDHIPLLLARDGVVVDNATGAVSEVSLCTECHRCLLREEVPPLSYSNGLFLGAVPPELEGLTFIEESIIARARAKCWIVHLKEDQDSADGPVLPHHQRGFKGHIIAYPQRPESLAEQLPRSIEDIVTPICIIFVGSRPPTRTWLEQKATPLIVRRERILRALQWLQANNTLYESVDINQEHLSQLPVHGMLPYVIQHIEDSSATDSLTSRYDTSEEPDQLLDAETDSSNACPAPNTGPSNVFHRVVVTDVDGRAPPNELRAAAIRHIKKKGGGYVQIPHGPTPLNEFCNPDMFPSLYPTLFPYGVGGLEDRNRSSKVSLKRHVRHLLSLKDRRFQEHHTFLFTAFNILQRRAVLLHSSLKVKRTRFRPFTKELAEVSEEAVARVCSRIADHQPVRALDAEERKVLKLMDEVQMVNRNVPGSSAARLAMRNEVRALMVTHGTPHFYLTINPADLYNPVVKFLSGEDIDVDKLLPAQVPDPWKQSLLVARNPIVAAKFFDLYIKSFISTLLGYDSRSDTLSQGIFGVTKAYYGCVEAQGRGTLHCHMVVWVEGGMNPTVLQNKLTEDVSDFGRRLVAFLDDSISTEIPVKPAIARPEAGKPPHPCAIRGVDVSNCTTDEQAHAAVEEDVRRLVLKCQVHTHGATCFKYCRDGQAKECRFDLDPCNVVPETTIDPITGMLTLRKVDGMVNNYNSTILRALRCNMDVQFIGSGEEAKAIVYYITDYITKTQLKSHIAYAALQLAVKTVHTERTDGAVRADTDPTARAKRMLQRCAFSLSGNQELSAPQVASYLLDNGDKYSSHQFRNLYWPSFERYIERESPAGEMPSAHEVHDGPAAHEDEVPTEDHDSPLYDHDTNDDDDVEYQHLDEVTIGRTASGDLVEVSSQLVDYTLRGDGLEDLCLWDFVSTVDKVGAGVDTLHGANSGSLENDLEASVRRRRRSGFFPFQPAHPEYGRRRAKLLPLQASVVPVPIGPALPRFDREDERERYCRLMILLFRPWRVPSDLRTNSEDSWESTYTVARETFQPRHSALQQNIDVLNQCRDSREDTLRRGILGKRQNRLAALGQLSAPDLSDSTSLLEPPNEREVLEHLLDIDSTQTARSSRTQLQIDECVREATRHRLYRFEGISHETVQPGDVSFGSDVVDIDNSPDVDISLEARWQHEYQSRRAQWKRMLADRSDSASASMQPRNNAAVGNVSVVAGFPPGNVQDHLDVTLSGDPIFAACEASVDLERHADEWTLNTEQRRAFRIISEHSLRSTPEPLRMFLGGFGGTGKSRVIQAVTSYFAERKQPRRMRLASFTGIAARNIAGSTLHAALALSQQKQAQKIGSKTYSDLMAMWEGVDYLLIDEVSMIGCKLLARVSEALAAAKGISTAFGGMSIILAGDFAQLPPVSEKRLYGWVNTYSRSKAGRASGQQIVLGKLLWLSFNTVIDLKEIMRQTGCNNAHFVDLLSRLREGRCNQQDYVLLNTRLLTNQHQQLAKAEWTNAPTIVYDNASKDALNVLAVTAFAERTGRTLHWYHARDKYDGRPLQDPVLIRYLEGLHSGQTRYRLGRIPLVIGMPVMVMQNFDVNGGVVNGTIGTLSKIRFRTDRETGHRRLRSCVVRLPGLEGTKLAELDEEEYPIMEDGVSMTFEHPFTGVNCTIRRTQVPIQPAFAITAHKSQGQTFSHVIVDLESCSGTEAPYVMLSRAKSLDGVIILRPFHMKKITCNQSQDIRREVDRLNILALKTIVAHGTPAEARAAMDALHTQDANVQYDKPEQLTSSPLQGQDRAATLQRVQLQQQADYNRRKRKLDDSVTTSRVTKKRRNATGA